MTEIVDAGKWAGLVQALAEIYWDGIDVVEGSVRVERIVQEDGVLTITTRARAKGAVERVVIEGIIDV